MLLLSADVHQAAAWSHLAPALRTWPTGLGWAQGWLPVSPTLAGVAFWALCAGAALALVGLFTRPAALVASLSALYLLTLPQLSGTVMHTHHLVWFSALLAASPCADALSLDAWWARRRGRAAPAPAAAYGVPLRLAWAMVALIFFFPGVWKWREAGAGWALSDNLVHLMHWKWLQAGTMPSLRLDLLPGLVRAGGLGVLLFEVALPFLLLFRATRLWAVGAALLFHLATEAFFLIGFSSLWACYTAFVPWHALLARLRGRAPEAPLQPEQGRWLPAAVVGGAVLLGQLLTGVLGMEQAWPVACYPTFRWRATGQMPVLVLEVERASGARTLLPDEVPAGPAGQRRWGAVWSLLASPRPERLEAWWRAQAHRLPPQAEDPVRRVRFFRGTLPVSPERRGEPPVRHALLSTLEVQ